MTLQQSAIRSSVDLPGSRSPAVSLNPVDVRLEAGARALCALHGADPDAPALKGGRLVPSWHLYAPEAHAVLAAADAVDMATQEMERAGVAAMKAGSQDAGSLVQRVWLAMNALRPGRGASAHSAP
jgi:hypothetical protein